MHDLPAQMGLRRTDVDDVSITQLSPIWNPVTNNFVDGPDLNMSPTIEAAGKHEGHPRAD